MTPFDKLTSMIQAGGFGTAYLVPRRRARELGRTRSQGEYTYVTLPAALDPVRLPSILAHELFHAIGFALGTVNHPNEERVAELGAELTCSAFGWDYPLWARELYRTEDPSSDVVGEVTRRLVYVATLDIITSPQVVWEEFFNLPLDKQRKVHPTSESLPEAPIPSYTRRFVSLG